MGKHFAIQSRNAGKSYLMDEYEDYYDRTQAANRTPLPFEEWHRKQIREEMN